MANNVTIFDNMPQLPADIASFFDEETNLVPRQTVPSLSYEGKIWTVSIDGEKTPLMRKNDDGDEVPVPVMRVLILDYNPNRGRSYYEGAYDPAKPQMPICWSDDGVAPSQYVKAKQSDVCSKCQWSVKGSKVTEQGKAVTACSQHRMIAVIPANRLDFEPLRLKLAITSDFDGQSPDQEAQGWFAFKNYTDMLRTKGVKHTAMLVTKMKFDPSVAYPKVLFSVDKWLEPEQLAQLPAIVKDERVTKLISGSWTPDGVDGKPVEQLAQQAAPASAPVPAKPVPAASVDPRSISALAAKVEAEEAAEEEAAIASLPAKGAKPAAKPAAKPTIVAKPVTKVTAKEVVKGKPANGAGGDDLDSLLSDWA